MREKLFRGVLPAVVAVSAFVLIPQVAHAGGKYTDCSTASCEFGLTIEATTFHVDADVHGSGTATWSVSGQGRTCSTTFRAEDPARSWTCSNYPTGHYTVKVSGPRGPSNIGIRW
ncbi:hypothetical protein M8C13_34955 [Crossiella sp. SN42]|uniref:hypothetical protein n=1 Tax=Crossiella sp. SN42 TaxID=2944808 RepID=UPI00207C7939|nr:hypothetical protein [Crossiella sp. SN42]MCO1580969.1 hypothetical protein [Crossiella sp. SN42]